VLFHCGFLTIETPQTQQRDIIGFRMGSAVWAGDAGRDRRRVLGYVAGAMGYVVHVVGSVGGMQGRLVRYWGVGTKE
jgi:hypothetical protein